MPKEKLIYYWDTNVFINAIQKVEPHISTLLQIIDDAKNDRCAIITSAFTLAEVIKDPNAATRLSDKDEQLLQDLMENPYITLRTVDRSVGNKAREIVRWTGLKAPDAIHVATATLNGADILQSYDTHLIKLNATLGVPPLRIERPSVLQPRMILKVDEQP